MLYLFVIGHERWGKNVPLIVVDPGSIPDWFKFFYYKSLLQELPELLLLPAVFSVMQQRSRPTACVYVCMVCVYNAHA